MICTVSMPEISSKNQPQLVYMSWAWRSSSMSSRAVVRSVSVRWWAAWAAKKRSMSAARAVKDDLDVGVAGGPEIFQQACGELFRQGRGGVAEVVEGFAQRGAPLLVPAGFAAVAAAVGAPAFDAVGAAPGGVFGDFGLPLGRKFFEELAVVGQAWPAAFFDPVHGVGEGHLAVLVVVAVAFAVGGDVGELGDLGIAGRGGMEAGEETAAEVFAAVEQAFEGDGAGAGAIVEEDGDAAAFVEAERGRDGWGRRWRWGSRLQGQCRCSVRCCRVAGMAADAGALDGGEDGELDALLRHEVEDAAVDGGFGEPHAFGFAAEAGFEVGDAPADLGEGVAAAGQRHDDVVVDLGDGGAMAAVALRAELVGVEDHAIGARGFVLEPAEQGGAEVEAHPRVVVHDADDLVLLVGDAGGAVGGVTLGGDAVVPVVIGRGGVLGFDGLEPGVLARRLVEVTVDADEARRLGGGEFDLALLVDVRGFAMIPSMVMIVRGACCEWCMPLNV